MTTTLLIICIPITALVVGFLVLKSVQLGLRWQIETKQEQKPTLDVSIPNPIAPIMQRKEEQEVTNILSEWLNGPPETR